MNRFWIIIPALLLIGAGLLLYGKLHHQPDSSEVLVPLQLASSPDSEAAVAAVGCSADEGFEKLSAELARMSVDLADPQALQSLSAQELGMFVDRAIACPAVYFSPEYSHASGKVVATWLQRQSFNRIRPRAWQACLKLRWTAASISEMAEPCRQTLSPLGERWVRGRLDWAETLVSIEDAEESVRAAARRYANNPYCGKALIDLALALHRHGHPELASSLRNELMQISVDKASRLEHGKARQRW